MILKLSKYKQTLLVLIIKIIIILIRSIIEDNRAINRLWYSEIIFNKWEDNNIRKYNKFRMWSFM